MICKSCSEDKSIDDYYTSNKKTCKECIKSRAINNRLNKIEYYRSYDKARASQPKRKANAIKVINAWKAQFPNRRKAQIILGNAVRDGRIEKQPCFICGEKSEAHHPDYDRPLDVVWLCPAHHKQVHAMAKKLKLAA